MKATLTNIFALMTIEYLWGVTVMLYPSRNNFQQASPYWKHTENGNSITAVFHPYVAIWIMLL